MTKITAPFSTAFQFFRSLACMNGCGKRYQVCSTHRSRTVTKGPAEHVLKKDLTMIGNLKDFRGYT